MKLKKVFPRWKRETGDDSIFHRKCTIITSFKHASIAQFFWACLFNSILDLQFIVFNVLNINPVHWQLQPGLEQRREHQE